MPTTVTIGQKWSVWSPGRQQWLLATVVERENNQITLKYHAGYGIGESDNQQKVDEATMLTGSNLFRFVAL